MGCKEAGSLRLPVFWLRMWRCAGLGFALEDVDDDHVAATARADHPRLFGWGVNWHRVVSVFGRALRYIQKLTNSSNLSDAHAAG